MIKVVIDTNILVSGLLTLEGNAAAILNLLFNGKITLLYDERILREYTHVLARKKFRFDPNDVNNLIQFIRYFGEAVSANPVSFVLQDKGDLPFLEVAETVPADFLITGNLKDCPNTNTKTCILSPFDFLNSFGAEVT